MASHRCAYLAAIAAIVAALSGCGKKDAAADTSGETIATVNGQAIPSREFYDYLVRKSSVVVPSQQGPQMAQTLGPVGLQALRDLVNRKLVLQMAKDQGVLPTDADVQKELDFRNASEKGYTDSYLKNGGVTLDDLKQDVLFELAREKLVTKGVTVPMSEVDQYIKENPKDFSIPAKASLLFIALKTPEKKTKVDAALVAGKSFKSVASEFSDAPNAKTTGGAVPDAPLQGFPPELQSAISKTAPLHTTDWLTIQGTYIKIYVLSKSPEKQIELTPVIKENVQRKLMSERGELTNDVNAKLLEKMRGSSIDVALPALQRPWTEMFDEIKKAPATPPAGSAPPAARTPGPTSAPSSPHF